MDFVDEAYYLYFLPATLFLTFLAGRRKKNLQLMILLLMSYIFFLIASGWHIILLLISTILDWTAAKRIENTDELSKRKKWLTGSLVTNLSLLGVFKYLDLIIESLNLVSLKINQDSLIDPIGLALPVGISFYTFQTMSYTIDVYLGKQKTYDSFTKFACYAAFFPQLVAGPIVRADHFKDELEKEISFNPRNLKVGLTFIVYGICKKLVIADNLALHANTVFVEGEHLANIGLIWWATLCFGIQIYCDFSAYTDIAIGSAFILGIKLPENFKTPYAARTPQDFWRRWHISLSTWLRDYLYIPLGGSRNGQKRMLFALMVTMILGGLWHGASWNFILWGLVHGLLLVAHRFGSELSPIKWIFSKSKVFAGIFSWLITQYLIFFTWLIFRIENTNVLLPAMKTFLTINGHFDSEEFFEILPEIKIVTFLIAALFILLHAISGKVGRARDRISDFKPILWGLSMGMMLSLAFYLRPVETIDFIYFRF